MKCLRRWCARCKFDLRYCRYYERAPEYGNKTNKQGGSETVIGRALAAAPSLKEKAFVTTKCTLQPYTEEKIRAACAYSSEKLQTDCIELYQLHGWDPNTPIADQLGVLAALQKEGKIKCEQPASSCSARTILARGCLCWCCLLTQLQTYE